MKKNYRWKNVLTNAQCLISGQAYIPTSASLTVFTLPTTYNIGDSFIISGQGSGGWQVQQNVNQCIVVGVSTTAVGTGGSIASTHQQDVVEIVCVGINQFKVINVFGNITIT